VNLPGYDEWKTRGPDWDDGPTCEKCGEFLRKQWQPYGGWFCEECDFEDEYWQALADGQGSLIELEDAEILAEDLW
jgi:hypothetical protein